MQYFLHGYFCSDTIQKPLLGQLHQAASPHTAASAMPHWEMWPCAVPAAGTSCVVLTKLAVGILLSGAALGCLMWKQCSVTLWGWLQSFRGSTGVGIEEPMNFPGFVDAAQLIAHCRLSHGALCTGSEHLCSVLLLKAVRINGTACEYCCWGQRSHTSYTSLLGSK